MGKRMKPRLLFDCFSRHQQQLTAALQALFRVCKKMFAALPLAAVIGGNTLIVHGGEASHTPCGITTRPALIRMRSMVA